MLWCLFTLIGDMAFVLNDFHMMCLTACIFFACCVHLLPPCHNFVIHSVASSTHCEPSMSLLAMSLLLHLHHHFIASVMALLSLPALSHMLSILFTPPLAGCHIDACTAHVDMLPSQRLLWPQWQGLTLNRKGISLPSAASASHVASAGHL